MNQTEKKYFYFNFSFLCKNLHNEKKIRYFPLLKKEKEMKVKKPHNPFYSYLSAISI